MAHPLALLDSDMLSEIMKGRDPRVLHHAREYLQEHRVFQFSIVTRYEVLRGLQAKDATRQIAAFLARCRASVVYPLTEEVVDLAAEIYGSLRKRGQLISDGDLLIASTALLLDLVLVTGNVDHFQRIEGLRFLNWRTD
ncbi:MAG TPA: type II toxin-antitoxin system VapC family toxin [Thermoanaerobaculia bacterium]|jgi:tRNA(fMet)-specific endonuclease VapC|nr:type II toxin-antitoxin system VapC family toxin [Thermoanaerobaculia bacterium]